jgi:hypothetical protein
MRFLGKNLPTFSVGWWSNNARPPSSKNVANWQTQFFFRTQLTLPYVITSANEFANLGKLTWQTGKLIFPDQALAVY